MYCTGAKNGAVYLMHRWVILALPSNLTAPVQYYILIGHVLLSRLLELPKISLEGHLPGREYHTAFSYAALVLHQHFKWHGNKKKLGVTPESWQDPHEGIQDCNHTYSTNLWLNNSWCVYINADKGFLLVIASSLWLLVCFPSRLVQWSIIHDSAALPSDIKPWNAWIHLDPSHWHFHSTSSDMAIRYGNIIKSSCLRLSSSSHWFDADRKHPQSQNILKLLRHVCGILCGLGKQSAGSWGIIDNLSAVPQQCSMAAKLRSNILAVAAYNASVDLTVTKYLRIPRDWKKNKTMEFSLFVICDFWRPKKHKEFWKTSPPLHCKFYSHRTNMWYELNIHNIHSRLRMKRSTPYRRGHWVTTSLCKYHITPPRVPRNSTTLEEFVKENMENCQNLVVASSHSKKSELGWNKYLEIVILTLDTCKTN